MNVGSATRRYLPIGVTARRKPRCFYSNEGENLLYVAAGRREHREKRNERKEENGAQLDKRPR